MIATLSHAARAAGLVLAHATRAQKDSAIEAIAQALIIREEEILAANNEDVIRSRGEESLNHLSTG